MRSASEMAGHFFVKWLVRLSIRPLGKFSPHALQVCGYRLLLSFSLGPRSKYCRIRLFGRRPIVAFGDSQAHQVFLSKMNCFYPSRSV